MLLSLRKGGSAPRTSAIKDSRTLRHKMKAYYFLRGPDTAIAL